VERKAYEVDAGTPRIRRLRFSNILARRARFAAVFMLGLPEMNVEDVTLEGLSLYLDRDNTEAGAADMGPGIDEICRAGIMLENARNVRVRRVDLYDQLGPAVTIRKSTGVRVSDLSARHDGNSPLILTDDAEFEADDGSEKSENFEGGSRWPNRIQGASVKRNGNGNGNGKGNGNGNGDDR
jgi:hypothetical protein